MQTLMIPQSPMIGGNGLMAGEWLVFMNEFIRLCNNVIISDAINQAASAALIASGFRYAVDFERDETIQNVAISAYADAQIEAVALTVAKDETIDQASIVVQPDDQQQDNPYALISSIEQQLYDQQIWSLNA